jgi:hypothetical protein
MISVDNAEIVYRPGEARETQMVPEIPRNPPIEIREEGQAWVVAAYDRGEHAGTTFLTEGRQMDALRAAKARMETDRHPCVVRWDSPDSIRNVYWNPDFESLAVRHDSLVDGWTVVPESSTCAIEVCESRADAQARAQTLQREYDFKHLRVYDRNGTCRDERDHRFLRYNVTDSGVRFDRSAVERQDPPDVAVEDDEAGAESITSVGPATPGRLGVSVPDITQVQFVDTDGVCNQYRTPWGDGTTATVVAVSQKYANHEAVREGFEARMEPWLGHDDAATVATVHESGTDPTSWVAYQSGDHGLDEAGMSLSLNERVAVLDEVVTAISTVSEDHDICGIEPRNVRLRDIGAGSRRVTVANWGVRWAATAAVAQEYATPFTAPEQLGGRIADTTAVYGVGALAYWLFCESTPVDAGDARAIRTGDLRPPETLTAVPSGVEPVLERALATDPTERFGSVQTFHTELAKLL